MGQVQNKIALVTGGASGIGAACAQTLAREGAKVVVSDIDDSGGDALVATITSAGHEAIFLSHDVTDERRWQEVIAETERHFGRLDILVSNTGIGLLAPSIVDMSLADWRRQTAVNLDGVFLSVKYCLPLMRRSGGGSIIMTSSVAGLRGSATLAGYCATKGGVRLFAKSIAMECAAKGDGIRVNSVHPGIIDTDLEQNSARPGERWKECTDRHRGDGASRCTAWPRGSAAGHCQWGTVSRLGCVELHNWRRTRHRWRHYRRIDFAQRTASSNPGPCYELMS